MSSTQPMNASVLIAKFPYMFRRCWPLEMYRGWMPLVVDACQRIDALLGRDKRRFRWWTVREKFGWLNLGYVLVEPGRNAYLLASSDSNDPLTDEIADMVATAERASMVHCIYCGEREAQLCQVAGFHLVVCREHFAAWEELARAFPAQHAQLILQAALEPDTFLHWRPFLPLLPQPAR